MIQTMNGAAYGTTNFYPVTNGVLQFDSGTAEKAISITVYHDAKVTGNLDFGVALFNPTNSSGIPMQLGNSNAVVTIHDADTGFYLSDTNYTVSKTNGSATTATRPT